MGGNAAAACLLLMVKQKCRERFYYPPPSLAIRQFWGEGGRAYPRHQNDYMQLCLVWGINFLKIIITITSFNP